MSITEQIVQKFQTNPRTMFPLGIVGNIIMFLSPDFFSVFTRPFSGSYVVLRGGMVLMKYLVLFW